MAAMLMLLSCASRTYHPQTSIVEMDGEKMLVGPLVFADILHYFPDWNTVYEEAEVPTDLVQKIQAINRPLTIRIFLGTWCGDSRDGVPPFMKILERAQNAHLRVELIGVDRQKLDPDGLAIDYHIERVPTFIILENGSEIGRMVEFPEKTFAEDLLDLLAQSNDE
ncbi:MAG: hypothetical protein GXO78_03425 [Calditrichaeota bacterium]|nr:hypothetical protein [Calditrichota bacterium]